MTRRDRRSKQRVLAALASLLGAAAMGVSLGLFTNGDIPGNGVSPLGQTAQVSMPQADGDFSTVIEGQQKQIDPPSQVHDAQEEREQQQIRRMKATPSEQIRLVASASSNTTTNGGTVDPSDPRRNCVLRPAALAPADLHTPVFAASYPGSGSRMLRHLIEALTGVATGDEWFRNTRRAVAIKTHYPHSHGTALDFGWVDDIQGAILLLRNPRDAIPSFCNHLYERKHGMSDHSTRAPLEEWVKWRNIEFRKQLAFWHDTVVHWVERFPSDRRLVLAYESLTGKVPSSSGLGGGVSTTKKLASFLSKSVEGIEVVPQEQMNCVWYKVVKYDEAEHEEGGVAFRSLRADHPSGRSEKPYSRWQLEEMMEVFRTIKMKFSTEEDVVAVIESYEAEVTRNLNMHDIKEQQK